MILQCLNKYIKTQYFPRKYMTTHGFIDIKSIAYIGYNIDTMIYLQLTNCINILHKQSVLKIYANMQLQTASLYQKYRLQILRLQFINFVHINMNVAIFNYMYNMHLIRLQIYYIIYIYNIYIYMYIYVVLFEWVKTCTCWVYSCSHLQCSIHLLKQILQQSICKVYIQYQRILKLTLQQSICKVYIQYYRILKLIILSYTKIDNIIIHQN
eukprot:TRINITY_DN2031_c1_g1_i9.p2 TRINITY_DN2031_c1_g1~~TRINITY_DN2031_c1_g1_i9.p2  ORF type:complete len:211 (-),score=-53.69 TRINITY_DN2031_c1_g1_i9:1349-1981(-)